MKDGISATYPSWDERTTLFFSEYVHFQSNEAYTPSGNLTLSYMQSAVTFLLDENVFDFPDDMRRQAMNDYGIILPESLFPTAHKDGHC